MHANPPLPNLEIPMRTLTIATLVFCLGFLVTIQMNAQEREALVENIEEQVGEVFETYWNSSWSERADVMTASAFNEYVASMVTAYPTESKELLKDEYGIIDFPFPEFPDDYRRLPKKPAIEKAQKIRAKFAKDLSKKLGGNYAKFLDQLGDRIEKDEAMPELHSIKLGEDGGTATADCRVAGLAIDISFRFRLNGEQWKFDGKDEVQFFDRQR